MTAAIAQSSGRKAKGHDESAINRRVENARSVRGSPRPTTEHGQHQQPKYMPAVMQRAERLTQQWPQVKAKLEAQAVVRVNAEGEKTKVVRENRMLVSNNVRSWSK